MSEKERFDEWLYQLAGELSTHNFSIEHSEVALKWLKEKLPLNILKAAGKVDKKECLEVFNLFVKNTTLDSYDDIRYRHDGLAVFPIYQIRALLEALPDEEAEIKQEREAHLRSMDSGPGIKVDEDPR